MPVRAPGTAMSGSQTIAVPHGDRRAADAWTALTARPGDLLAGGAHAVQELVDAPAAGEIGATLETGHLLHVSRAELKRPVLPRCTGRFPFPSKLAVPPPSRNRPQGPTRPPGRDTARTAKEEGDLGFPDSGERGARRRGGVVHKPDRAPLALR